MPLGQRDPGQVLAPAGPPPRTFTGEGGWNEDLIARRDLDPLLVGPVDYWEHVTITAARLNAGTSVEFPVPIVAFHLAVFEAVTILVARSEPRNTPGGYDARHPGLGEMLRHLPRTEQLHLLAPNGDATDTVELYVYAGRFAAKVVG